MTKPKKPNNKSSKQTLPDAAGSPAPDEKTLLIDAQFRNSVLAGLKTRCILDQEEDFAVGDIVTLVVESDNGQLPLVTTRIVDVHRISISEFNVRIIPADPERKPYDIVNRDSYAKLEGYQSFAELREALSAKGQTSIEEAPAIVWSPAFLTVHSEAADETPAYVPPVEPVSVTEQPKTSDVTDPTEEDLSALCEKLGGLDFDTEDIDNRRVITIYGEDDKVLHSGTYAELTAIAAAGSQPPVPE